MKIFISWSGDRGQHFATTLRDWLALILPDAKPWTSTELRRGSNWTVELLDTLREARACLLCVTADGLDSTWEFFEAGMLHGSDEDPVFTRCLCLDVPPHALAKRRALGHRVLLVPLSVDHGVLPQRNRSWPRPRTRT